MPRFWEQHKLKILSFIIAVYSLPLHFSRALPYSYDGGWMTSLNLAIRDHLVFGRDFVFTYGPLGLISTRCNLYTSNFLFLVADLFFAAGCFHFIYNYVMRHKGWFWLALVAMLIFRTTAFSQCLFVIFIIYAALNFLNNFRSYFELGYFAVAGVLLFFIKINYGVLVIAALSVFVVMLAITSYRRLLFLLLVSGGLFAAICFTTHIDIAGYLRYSLTMAAQYDEAGYWPIKRKEFIYLSGLSVLLVLVGVLCYYLYRSWRQKTFDRNKLLFLGCIGATTLVLYRNAFTRADFYHYGEYFATMPFWALTIVVLCGLQKHVLPRVVVVVFVLVSSYNLMSPDITDDTLLPKLKANYYLAYYSPLEYVKGIFEKREKAMDPIRLLDKDKLEYIDKKTIDIIPWEVELLHYHDLNYHPRPMPVTGGYAGVFDSLNADFFTKPGRPEVVMIQNFPIDYKYFFWEESRSKTALRLNYRYIDYARVNNWSGALKDGYFDTYLLLQPRGDSQVQPQFEKIATQTLKLGDTLHLNYAPDEAIYITAHFEYTFQGKLRRMFYQPPNLNVAFRYEDGGISDYRASIPSLKDPALANKGILTQEEMMYFFAGDIKGCRNIKAICFHPMTDGFKPDFTIELMRLKNY
ncbi:MAG: hypothetical protein K0Q79_2540 [Flavipsychrobacter sp.]|jgi:hypothetical protein|nr:hypothetical protein [Flavipsychrobacter sp.]